MDIALILNTAALYISRFLDVKAKVYERNDTSRRSLTAALEDPAAREKVAQIVEGAAADSIYYLESDCTGEYCLVFLEEFFLLIGPYRTKTFQKSRALSSKTIKRDQLDALMQAYNMLPLVEEKDIEMVARIPFTSIYHNTREASEFHIQLQKPILLSQNDAGLSPQSIHVDVAMLRTMESLSLLSLLCEGNYPEVLNRYDSIMRTKQHPFAYVNMIEGLTTLRVLISIALNAMSVPASSSYLLLRQFKLRARMVSTKEEARSLAVEVLAQACQMIQEQAGLKYSDVTRSAIAYIGSHLSQPITIAQLAEEVHMTSSAFTRKFRSEMQMTPTEYINRERMREAADLLLFTHYDVRQICAQVGVLDANYFARCFKKQYGVSPTEYRKMRQNG